MHLTNNGALEKENETALGATDSKNEFRFVKPNLMAPHLRILHGRDAGLRDWSCEMRNRSATAVASMLEIGVSSVPRACYFDGYASAIKRFKLLERGQEQQLARRWQELRDRRAADELVTSHLRLAAKVARGYRGYGFPLSDIIAEANLGLVIAASRFEPGRGSRFSSYALWWIKATIHDYILRSWSLVKIGTTTAQRKLFFRLRREAQKFANGTTGLTPEIAAAIAQTLEVTPRDVVEMDRRLVGDLSLNTPVSYDGATTEWGDTLVDEAPDAEAFVVEHDESARQQTALHAALDVLTERERRVFEARRLAEDPATLEELGRELSISSERVRQIETRAFGKVKRAAWQSLRR